jgi:hypothetical protein
MQMKRNHAQRSFGLALAAGVIVLVLWNVPQLDFLLYPFRLFVTFAHESGHGLAALLTGGRFLGFEIFANGAGQAATAGGWRAIILPAGYLGAALFGGLLFWLTNRFHRPRLIAALLGGAVLALTVLYARGAGTALLVGLAFGAALLLLAWKAAPDLTRIILNVLAILCGLNAVLDLWYIVGNSGAGLGLVRNDAAAFAAEFTPLLPAWLWAIIWAAEAVFILGVAVWYSLKHWTDEIV